MEKKNLWLDIKLFLNDRFNLNEDKAQEQEVIETIWKGVEFKGTNLWILIFAIFLASIGLNVNSTAVIIGAMLVSPLMGPIMGIGLGVGISDFSLIKKAAKNLGIAIIIGILTSTSYFLITPLSDASSELLARTSPATWDVLIAFFGGLAGIVAGSRKDKSITVIPGVAIATALMPPLCTAGYGIASGNLEFFGGAMYLFFINAVFISLATYIIVRVLRYNQVTFVDPVRARKVKQSIYIIILVTLLPSIYFSYNLARKTVFESNASRFVKHELEFPNIQVISQSFHFEKGNKNIEVVLLGDKLNDEILSAVKSKMNQYNLGDVELKVIQGLSGKESLDINMIRSVVFEDLVKRNEQLIKEKEKRINELEIQLSNLITSGNMVKTIGEELKAQQPSLKSVSLAKSTLYSSGKSSMDTILIVYTSFNRRISDSERMKIENWLKVRTQSKMVKLLIE